MKIIVTPIDGDFVANLEDHPEVVTTASTPADAVVNLINSHRERFNIEIAYMPERVTR